MSTRGNFSFFLEQPAFCIKKKITFNVDCDSDPEGAAHYFWRMHTQRHHLEGEFAEIFFRSNPRYVSFAKFESIQEYEYYIEADGMLTAYKNPYDEERKLFFHGHYAEFINQNAGYVKQLKNFEYLYAVESDWVKNFFPSDLGFGLGVEVMPIGKYVGAEELLALILNETKSRLRSNLTYDAKSSIALLEKEYLRIKSLAKHTPLNH